jgi:hypothetical protein
MAGEQMRTIISIVVDTDALYDDWVNRIYEIEATLRYDLGLPENAKVEVKIEP